MQIPFVVESDHQGVVFHKITCAIFRRGGGNIFGRLFWLQAFLRSLGWHVQVANTPTHHLHIHEMSVLTSFQLGHL